MASAPVRSSKTAPSSRSPRRTHCARRPGRGARSDEARRLELIEQALNAANDRIDAYPAGALSERKRRKGMVTMVDEIFDRHYQAGRSN